MSDRDDHPKGLTVGAGIAIAGVWIGASATTIMFALIAFLWSPDAATGTGPDVSDEAMFWGVILTLLLIAAPLITAAGVTNRILGER